MDYTISFSDLIFHVSKKEFQINFYGLKHILSWHINTEISKDVNLHKAVQLNPYMHFSIKRICIVPTQSINCYMFYFKAVLDDLSGIPKKYYQTICDGGYFDPDDFFKIKINTFRSIRIRICLLNEIITKKIWNLWNSSQSMNFITWIPEEVVEIVLDLFMKNMFE